jgi:hypothetical protein
MIRLIVGIKRKNRKNNLSDLPNWKNLFPIGTFLYLEGEPLLGAASSQTKLLSVFPIYPNWKKSFPIGTFPNRFASFLPRIN